MPYQDFEALLSVPAAVLLDPRTGSLVLLLVIAAICDHRSHRIPNELVLCGALFGIAYATLAPAAVPGSVLFALSGLLVGLLLFLPLHFVGAMGAGDVKLLAMIGTFLGPVQTVYAALASMIVGGAMSVLWVAAHGSLPRMLQNLASMLRWRPLAALPGPAAARPAARPSVGKMSYGVPVAIGTIGYLIALQLPLR